jgi:hypothetical protein
VDLLSVWRDDMHQIKSEAGCDGAEKYRCETGFTAEMMVSKRNHSEMLHAPESVHQPENFEAQGNSLVESTRHKFRLDNKRRLTGQFGLVHYPGWIKLAIASSRTRFWKPLRDTSL